jgi:hypothetical protein
VRNTHSSPSHNLFRTSFEKVFTSLTKPTLGNSLFAAKTLQHMKN